MLNLHSDTPMIGAGHQNQAGLYNTGAKAVLYIFSKRPFDKQVRRSLVYRFGDAFTNKAADIIHRGDVSDMSKIDHLMQDRQSMESIVPLNNGANDSVTRMDYMGEHWTFLLIVNDEDAAHRVVAAGYEDVEIHRQLQHRLRNNRAIYYGIFLDEPINPLTLHSSSPTINPHAMLMVTHKTLINQMSSWGPHGQTPPQYSVMSDTDVVHPEALKMISSAELHNLTPEHLLDDHVDSTYDQYGNHVQANFTGVMTAINAHQSPFAIRADYSEPRQHLKQVLSGVVTGVNETFASAQSGVFSTAALDALGDGFGDHDAYTQAVINRLSRSSLGSEIGLREGEMVTLAMIESRYHPEVIPFDIQRHTQYDTMDQTVRSAANDWSSIVINAGVVLLTNAGLSEIALTHDSTKGITHPYHFSHVASASDTEKQNSVRVFIHMLESRIFPILIHGRGHFNLQLSLQSSGISNCVLNFYDDDFVNTAPFEVPTIAGGLNSTVLGTAPVAASNSSELAEFVSRVGGGDTMDTEILAGRPPSVPSSHNTPTAQLDRHVRHGAFSGYPVDPSPGGGYPVDNFAVASGYPIDPKK